MENTPRIILRNFWLPDFWIRKEKKITRQLVTLGVYT